LILFSHLRWSQLAKALYRFYKDLLLLENYAIMTYCSFSKILKKHDKNTGFCTRQAFMSNVVSTANFANYPEVVKMLKNSQVLFEEVAVKLQEEGTGASLSDEKLFIDMIHQLNAQATGVQKSEMAEIGIRHGSSTPHGVNGGSVGSGEQGSGDGGVTPLKAPVTINEIISNGGDADDIRKKLALVAELVTENGGATATVAVEVGMVCTGEEVKGRENGVVGGGLVSMFWVITWGMRDPKHF